MLARATARPWHDAPSAAGGVMKTKYSQGYAVANHDKAQLVAGCFEDVKGGLEQCKANAALIAHCVNTYPDLVEALEDAIRDLKDARANGIGQPSLERLETILAQAQQVNL